MANLLDVILVEDNPADVFLMEELLKESGVKYRLKCIGDGEAAIGCVREMVTGRQDLPDLFILDLNLPRKSGHEVLTEIRQHTKLDELRVVILTTSEDPQDRARALSNRADCFLTKPPALRTLQEVLDVVKEAWINIEQVSASTSALTPRSSPQKAMTQKSESNAQDQHVLLVEDNENDIVYLQELFKQITAQKYILHAVSSCQAAKAYLADNTVSVIIADLGLPDARGLDLLIKLQPMIQKVPLVIMTGMDDEDIGIKAVDMGAQDYLVKGKVNADTLLRSVRYAVARKRSEELAKMSVTFENSILQEILEHAPVSIVRFDKNLKITAYNPVFEQFATRVIGLEAASIDRDQSAAEIFKCVDSAHFDALIKEGKPFNLPNCLLFEKNNFESIVWDLAVWPIANRDEVIRGGIIIGLDVSQRRRLEQQREDFIASMAHDIKNPILGSSTVLESLIEGAFGEVSDEPSEILSLLKQSNDSLLLMLDNLLEVYRIESNASKIQFAPVRIHDVARAALKSVGHIAAGAGIKIEIDLPQDLYSVRADVPAVHRLLSNLLHNALKFSQGDGVVRLCASNLDAQVRITVTDGGIGMSKEELNLLFKRFGQSRSSQLTVGPGTGLGLYVCKQIVQKLEGTITCASEPGKGTTFIVDLPRYI